MIAQTILQQIGGRRFSVMTGSKNFTDIGHGLRMNLARNKTQANRLEIVLDEGTDTYIMKFYRQVITKDLEVKVTEVANYDMVYFDMLEDIFTSVTGLYTRF
mgnify:FL=1